MSLDKIDSGESEGQFNTYVDDLIKDNVQDLIDDGDFEVNGDNVVIESPDNIEAPTFVFDDDEDGEGGGGPDSPGDKKEDIKFSYPFNDFFSIISEKLKLPNLSKDGKGKIKEISEKFNTFGQNGVILDKRRTFKQALKSSIALGDYDPYNGKYDVLIKRKDKRYKNTSRIEKPKYKAVVFFVGDISWSTYGERLEIEKKLVNFIRNWVNFCYGPGNVTHRYFVHHIESYEVDESNFFKTNNAGGTRAFPAFDMVYNTAINEYPVDMTNFYLFYFGDGELFADDPKNISEIILNNYANCFSRVGICEIKPSSFSSLNNIKDDFDDNKNNIAKFVSIHNTNQIVETIKELFKERTDIS